MIFTAQRVKSPATMTLAMIQINGTNTTEQTTTTEISNTTTTIVRVRPNTMIGDTTIILHMDMMTIAGILGDTAIMVGTVIIETIAGLAMRDINPTVGDTTTVVISSITMTLVRVIGINLMTMISMKGAARLGIDVSIMITNQGTVVKIDVENINGQQTMITLIKAMNRPQRKS